MTLSRSSTLRSYLIVVVVHVERSKGFSPISRQCDLEAYCDGPVTEKSTWPHEQHNIMCVHVQVFLPYNQHQD